MHLNRVQTYAPAAMSEFGSGFPVIDEENLSSPAEVSFWANSRRKRVFDAALAATGLTLTLPLMAAVALAVKVSSRGPVLFRQERVGKHQAPFTILKFRTMRHDAEHSGPSVTCDGDRRTTRVGRVLRKLKLDELPQLVNVLRGDMSLVGPRPKLALHERLYLRCRPGITGAATLVFAREEELLARVPVEHVESYTVNVLNPMKARIDKEYAASASFRSDLRLLVRTFVRLSRKDIAAAPPELQGLENGSLVSGRPRLFARRKPVSFMPVPVRRTGVRVHGSNVVQFQRSWPDQQV